MTEKKSPEGLGGWLILPAIGIVLSIPSLAFTCWSSLKVIVFDGLWPILVDPESIHYIDGFIWAYPFELGCYFLFFVGYCYLAYLFFNKNIRFPRIFILLSLSYIAFLVIDLILSHWVFRFEIDKKDIRALIRSIIHTVIWVPYMLKSVRVKNTFVNGRRDEIVHQGIIS